MAKKDDNLIEMEKIYEEQQREYAEERLLEKDKATKQKSSLDHGIATGIRFFRMIVIILVIFFIIKYEFKLLGNFEDMIKLGGDSTSSEKKEDNKKENNQNNNKNKGNEQEQNYTAEVESIRIIGPAIMKEGDIDKLKVEFSPYNVADKTVQYVTTDPSVVYIEIDGTIRAQQKGTATIIAITPNKVQNKLVITVTE